MLAANLLQLVYFFNKKISEKFDQYYLNENSC